MTSPNCPYCAAPAEFCPTSNHVYGVNYGPIWHCAPCEAWVGCHPDDRPLGRLANKALRRAKIEAHAQFDPLWAAKVRRDGVTKKKARKAAYLWLANQLGISAAECHIGMFDEAQCARVVEICAPYARCHLRASSASARSPE